MYTVLYTVVEVYVGILCPHLALLKHPNMQYSVFRS
jgi:hypothetical protein